MGVTWSHLKSTPRKNFFLTSTCAGYRSIIVVETHTLSCSSWYTCLQRLIHTPCWTLPRLCLGGSCRRQLRQAHCTGVVPTAGLWARRTITYHNIGHSYRSWVPSTQNNQQAYTSVNSTGHTKAVDTINGIQTVELAITWHPDCRVSHYLASRLSNQPLLGIQTCRISSPCPTRTRMSDPPGVDTLRALPSASPRQP